MRLTLRRPDERSRCPPVRAQPLRRRHDRRLGRARNTEAIARRIACLERSRRGVRTGDRAFASPRRVDLPVAVVAGELVIDGIYRLGTEWVGWYLIVGETVTVVDCGFPGLLVIWG
jgi:hypothetical protein